MKRRDFLQCAALLISGTSAAQLGFSLSDEQSDYLNKATGYTGELSDFFNQQQRLVIAAIAEVIIPRTQTPGAIDAGVPRFIELMVAQWLSTQERNIFIKGLKQLQEDTKSQYNTTFNQLSASEQLLVLEQLEEQASSSQWYNQGNVMRDFISDAPFICQMKELTIWGFFTSEIGSKQVLRYNPMPMQFDGDIPLTADQSSWTS